MGGDVRLAELLCARLCHDLAGPVGAAAAGAELFEDLGGLDADAETLALVAQSAAGAAARLKFFRLAFGPAASGPQSSQALAQLTRAYFATQAQASSPGLVLDWPADGAVEGDAARLLLNLLLLAKDALPRGGRVTVAPPDARCLSILIHGEPAALTDEAREVLVENQPPSGPRGAQAAFTVALAADWGGRVAANPTPAGLEVAIRRSSAG